MPSHSKVEVSSLPQRPMRNSRCGIDASRNLVGMCWRASAAFQPESVDDCRRPLEYRDEGRVLVAQDASDSAPPVTQRRLRANRFVLAPVEGWRSAPDVTGGLQGSSRQRAWGQRPRGACAGRGAAARLFRGVRTKRRWPPENAESGRSYAPRPRVAKRRSTRLAVAQRLRVSKAPRSPSPTKLSKQSVANKQAKGKSASHHERRFSFPWRNSSPQLAAGGGSPSPR